MSQSIARLNEARADLAEADFLKCCGSKRWAQRMTGARPFKNFDELLSQADEIWQTLEKDDWLEAFRAHPKIGEKKAAAAQSRQAQSWSAQEQSGVAEAGTETISKLTELNRQYEERFGFIFIVCATGKSSEEMLSILNRRIQNDRETELPIAAEEQRKIMRLRLKKLVQST